MEQEPTMFVGVDWASPEHQVCMMGLPARFTERSPMTPVVLAQWSIGYAHSPRTRPISLLRLKCHMGRWSRR